MSAEPSRALSAELYDFSRAITEGVFGGRYFEKEYDGQVDSFGDGLELEQTLVDAIGEISETIEGYDGFDSPEEAYVFLSITPGINQGELADDLDSTRADIREMINGLEEDGLLETTGKRRGKKYFYGPKAFPYLRLASQLEEHVDSPVETASPGAGKTASNGGFEIPEDAENKEVLELGQELLDERANMEFESEDDGIDARDLTDEEEVDASLDEPEEGGGPEWF